MEESLHAPLLIGSVPLNRRVSALSNHGQDLGLQNAGATTMVQRHAAGRSRGNTGDAGVSGAKDSRPELSRLMAERAQEAL